MSFTYKKRPLNQPGVIRGDGVTITPGDTAAWRDYLQWMYAGNEPEEADIVSMPKPYISKRQIRDKMTDAELDAVEEARNSWPLRLRLMWDEATNNMVDPDDPYLIQFLDQVLGEERRKEVLGL